MATKDRDAFDYLGAFNQTRAASAAKEQAAATARIAEAQLVQAKAAQEIASAQAEAHRAAARAEQNRASMESEMFDREKNLRIAKAEIIRIVKSLGSLDIDLTNTPGSQLAKAIIDEIAFTSKKHKLLNDLGFESDPSEINSNMERIQIIEELLAKLESIQKYNVAKEYVSSALELQEIGAQINQFKSESNAIRKINETQKDQIQRNFSEWTNGNELFPTEPEYKNNIKLSKESTDLDNQISQRTNFYATTVGAGTFGFLSWLLADFGYGFLILLISIASFFFIKSKLGKKIQDSASKIKANASLYDQYINGTEEIKKLESDTSELNSIHERLAEELKVFGETKVRDKVLSDSAYEQFTKFCNSY